MIEVYKMVKATCECGKTLSVDVDESAWIKRVNELEDENQSLIDALNGLSAGINETVEQLLKRREEIKSHENAGH